MPLLKGMPLPWKTFEETVAIIGQICMNATLCLLLEATCMVCRLIPESEGRFHRTQQPVIPQGNNLLRKWKDTGHRQRSMIRSFCAPCVYLSFSSGKAVWSRLLCAWAGISWSGRCAGCTGHRFPLLPPKKEYKFANDGCRLWVSDSSLLSSSISTFLNNNISGYWWNWHGQSWTADPSRTESPAVVEQEENETVEKGADDAFSTADARRLINY